MMITIITDEVSECQRTRAYLPYRPIGNIFDFSLHEVIQSSGYPLNFTLILDELN